MTKKSKKIVTLRRRKIIFAAITVGMVIIVPFLLLFASLVEMLKTFKNTFVDSTSEVVDAWVSTYRSLWPKKQPQSDKNIWENSDNWGDQ